MTIIWNKVTWYSKLLAVIMLCGAIWLGFYFNSEFKKVADIKPVAIAQVNEKVDTSDWKTYKNEKYGFEFKYPSDWKQSDIDYGNGEIVFVRADNEQKIKKDIKPDTDNMVVVLEGEAIFLELDEIIDDRDKKYISEIYINNKKVYKLKTNYEGNLFGGGLLEGYFFEKRSGRYVYIGVHYWSDNPSDNLKDKELRVIIESIISTFKFTK